MKTFHKHEVAPSSAPLLLSFLLSWIFVIVFGYIAIVKLSFFSALAAMDGEATYRAFWQNTHFVWFCLCVISGVPLFFAYLGIRRES